MNKKFKQGSKSSKRALSRANCGKVKSFPAAGAFTIRLRVLACDIAPSSLVTHHALRTPQVNHVKGGGSTAVESSRADRLNKARQNRDEQRRAQVSSRRGLGGVLPPPRLVVLFNVTKTGLTGRVRSAIFGRKVCIYPAPLGRFLSTVMLELSSGRALQADEMEDKADESPGPKTGSLPGLNQRVTVVEAPRNMLALLDLMMVRCPCRNAKNTFRITNACPVVAMPLAASDNGHQYAEKRRGRRGQTH